MALLRPQDTCISGLAALRLASHLVAVHRAAGLTWQRHLLRWHVWRVHYTWLLCHLVVLGASILVAKSHECGDGLGKVANGYTARRTDKRFTWVQLLWCVGPPDLPL